MTLIFGGRVIQTWAQGFALRALADDAPELEKQARKEEENRRLPDGARWNIPLTVADQPDQDALHMWLLTHITTELLPVFDQKPLAVGHRPWLLDDPGAQQADAE